MGATISTTTKTTATTTIKTLTLTQLIQTRNFARYVPYKPAPKSKLHKNLRTIKTLKSHLETSYLISPLPCHGFSANQFKPLKSPLSSDPSVAKVVVVKNKLAGVALSGTQWEKLGQCLKGMNSLLFVKKEECVAPAISGVKSAVKEGKMEFNEFTGAVVGGELYGHLDLEVLEKAPPRNVADGLILGSVFGPSSSLMAVLEGFGESEGGDGKEGEGESASA